MLFMLSYKPYPGKGARAVELRHRWDDKYSTAFRKHVNIIHEYADPAQLVGYILLEIDDHPQLSVFLSLQSVFGDVIQFELHPVIDVRQAFDEGAEEPAGLF